MAKVAPSCLGATWGHGALIESAGLVLSEHQPACYMWDGFWNLDPTRCCRFGGPAVAVAAAVAAVAFC
jgi:hypothetical protein